MVADASIYGQIKPTQPLEGPLDQYGKVIHLKALMGQGRLQDLQTQQLEQNMSEEQGVRDVFKNAPVGGTLESLVPEVLRASPKAGIEFQGKVLSQQKTKADLEKINLEVTAAKAKDARDGLAGVTDQQSYDQWRQAATSKGYQVAQTAPPVFDPTWQQQHLMTADQFITNVEHEKNRALTKAGQTETARHNAVTELHNKLSLAETGRHHAALEGDPQTIEDTAQAIAKGQLAPLSGFALSRPMAQNIMARVVAINPEFDPTAFQTMQKAEKDFATGKQGNTVRSFNVALYHLDSLDKLADALNNGNTQLVNKIGNTIATQTGGTAPTNFAAAKKLVGDEIVKAIVGSGGGVSDREEAAKTIDAANSPAQLKGVINTYKELMHGQLKGLRTQYEATTKKKDFGDRYLSPEVRELVKQKEGGSNPDLEAALRKYGG